MRAAMTRETSRNLGNEQSIQVMTRRQTAIQTSAPNLDVGLFPNTLVMPTGASLPSVFSVGARARLEWQRLKARALDLGSLFSYKWLTGARPRPKLRGADVADEARRLHHDMWTAFAAGDAARIAGMCASGLAGDLTAKMAGRGKGGGTEWTLHQYNGRAKVVSHRAASMPNVDKLALRQAVVRISSRQSMKRVGVKVVPAKGKVGGGGGGGGRGLAVGQKVQAEVPKEEEEDTGKDLVEYVVIQKKLAGNKESDWYVWGTTKETDITPIIAGAK